MKYGVHINMERTSESQSMYQSMQDATELAVIADRGGMDLVATGEHHTIEMNICPNPLVQLANWAHLVKNARLGTSILAVPYWHPIRLAEEAAQLDHLSDGRLELGLGRGAFQYEFNRMGGGITPDRARELTAEVVPLVKKLWTGDASRDLEPWSFPRSTAVPKPLQEPGPPIWVSARHPAMFELAAREGCDVMANPLAMPMSEVESLVQRRDDAVRKVGATKTPRLMILRDLYVYREGTDWRSVLKYQQNRYARFETLFQDKFDVVNGFPAAADLDLVPSSAMYTLENLHEQHLIGTPEMVLNKLQAYADLGIDYIFMRLTFGLPHSEAKRSLELFNEEVLPEARRRFSSVAPAVHA